MSMKRFPISYFLLFVEGVCQGVMMKVIYELGRKSLEENEDAYLQTLTLPPPDKKTLKYGVILDFQNSDSSIHFIL